jgi:hypothetical protein
MFAHLREQGKKGWMATAPRDAWIAGTSLVVFRAPSCSEPGCGSEVADNQPPLFLHSFFWWYAWYYENTKC